MFGVFGRGKKNKDDSESNKKGGMFGRFGGGNKDGDDKGGMFGVFGRGKKNKDDSESDKKGGMFGRFGGGNKEPKPNDEQETNISGTSSVKTNKITGTTTINIYTNQ